ncbi:MAG: uroporphyrinogen-III synthase [Bacteroidales bacterium]|nr:uroporphyrinogen-III synthase [Bacteroidales bacterium]
MHHNLLKGKQFIYTRSEGDSSELRNMLAEYGGELIDFPTIEVTKRELLDAEKRIIEEADSFDWIILTSSNAVKYLFEYWAEFNKEISLFNNVKFAVVGAQTGETLKKYGFAYNYINKGITGVEFANELTQIISSSQKALYPTGTLTGSNMESTLGERITRVNIYKTTLPKVVDKNILQQIIDFNYDMLIFTSPSGFDNLVELISSEVDIKLIPATCIGTTTKNAMLLKGVNPLAVATSADSFGIAQSIINYYKTDISNQ